MASEKDIVAAASEPDPETLDLETLDSIIGGAESGGTNTSAPVDRSKGHGKWIDILSFGVPSFEQVTAAKEFRKK